MNYKIVMAFLITMLMISSVFSSANLNIEKNKEDELKSNTPLYKPDIKEFDNKLSNYLPHNHYGNYFHPISCGITLDQYQTYGDCWVGTNFEVTKIAQRFKPTLEYFDKAELKVCVNFTSPEIDIIFYESNI